MVPFGSVFEDRVCDGYEPSWDCDDNELVLFPTLLQSLCDGFQNRIMTRSGERGLVQGHRNVNVLSIKMWDLTA
ncbi:hypothetical protein BJF95_05260 [Rhizobium oryziradicis]|uniref:Uncharacterized protein n=1 Tax=Rhizobium oryziradicis TaxID=1867956 RepID=A0A1Q8ZST3_9HYPH|nr:hypothetical protein BJF95_05260 [Rhizobium oryziradicis]